MRPIIAFALIIVFSCCSSAAEKLKPLPANPNFKSVVVVDLSWSGDLASALEQAAKEKKLVFIDFTGVTCTNCKINEKNVFVKQDVKDLFKQYIRVQLYTDTIPENFYKEIPAEEKREKDAEMNQEFQKKAFKMEQLPLYAIVKPADGGSFETVGVYDEGKINKVDKFIEFLKKPLKGE
jgi:thiol:disulfide interchange protein DsbD